LYPSASNLCPLMMLGLNGTLGATGEEEEEEEEG
jgi:hypothetical protein